MSNFDWHALQQQSDLPGSLRTNPSVGNRPGISELETIKSLVDRDSQRTVEIESLRNDLKLLKEATQKFRKDSQSQLETTKKSVNDELARISNESANERMKTVEVIGIFVSIFTFVSAEITIMRGTCVVYWSGFTLILLGGLSFFVLMMRFMFIDLGSSGVNFANEKIVIENRRFIDGVLYNLKSVGSRIGYSTIILFVCSMILVLGGLAQTRSAMYNEADVCKNVTDPNYSLILNGGETNVRVTR